MGHGTAYVTPEGGVVCCLMSNREAFDKINAPAVQYGPGPGAVEFVTSKTIGKPESVMVVFQFWTPVETHAPKTEGH